MIGTDNPLVTVAMVTYNSAKYVRVAIESVLASNYANFELIISDDCSTDETWSIVCGYNDPRIIATRNEKNMGEYPNRNKCIDLAKGKYFLFIDGDDVILPIGLETYLRYAESSPGVGMVIEKGYFNNIIFPARLNPVETFEWEFGRRSLLTSSFSSNLFVTEILIQEGKLSEQFKTGDDEIRYRIAMKYDVLFIPGWFTWPRETPGQASAIIDPTTGLLETIQRVEFVMTQHQDNSIREMAAIFLNHLKRTLTKQYIKAMLQNKKANPKVKKYLSLNLLVFPDKINAIKTAYTAENPYYKIP